MLSTRKIVEEQKPFLLQEIYQTDPWKLLICCIMLNCTSRKQVDQVRFRFFKMYPNPRSVIRMGMGPMLDIIAPLGMKKVRAIRIWKFSCDWLRKDWKEPIELYGIGKYGQDSWEIFIKGNLDVKPNDGVLNKYLARIRDEESSSDTFASTISLWCQ